MTSCIEPKPQQDPKRVEFDFHLPTVDRRVSFRANVPLSSCAEAYVAVELLPSMRSHARFLGAAGTISKRFADALSTIQNIHRSWDRSLHPVQLSGRVISVVRPLSVERRVGLFFSGGVDSCYSLLKHQEEITDLIFVRGFDLPPQNRHLCELVSKRVREVAAAFEKRLIEVETNIRELLDPFADWCDAAHGAAMAAVGYLLHRQFDKIYFAAPHTYANLFPCGSHPLLDPLWSTEGLEFVHDGCEATRIEKVSLLATSDVCLRNLRVCFKNTNGTYNCGKCEKCLRTMINLHIVCALEACEAFDQPLNLRRVARIEALEVDSRSYIIENLRALEQKGIDSDLIDALRCVLQKPRWWVRANSSFRGGIRRFLECVPGLERRVRHFVDR